MPKLPTVENFGARPALRGPGNVVSFRAGIAETVEAQYRCQYRFGGPGMLPDRCFGELDFDPV